MRETVAAICSGFGPSYSRRKHAEGEPPTELWDALAEQGLPRREHPRGVGRRRARDVRRWPRWARRSPPPAARCC